MFIKTNIPETTLSLAGHLVDFGDRMFDHSSVNDRTNQIQDLATGNRCGHQIYAPRFFYKPSQHKPRPSVIERAIEKLKDVYRFPKKFYKKLGTFHASDRQVRSERREAIASVSQVLLHYLELSTLRVGFYASSDKFISLDLEYIAKKAVISLSRAKRAIKALVEAGYIKVTRQYKREGETNFSGIAAIRELNAQFFIDLGIDMQKLWMAREWKQKKEEKVRAQVAMNKLKNMLHTITSHKISTIGYKIKKTSSPTVNVDQALINQALTLHKLNPEKAPSDYLKELQQLNE